MADKPQGGHGMSGMHMLIKSACNGTEGVVSRGREAGSGTLEHTFGRLVAASNTPPDRDKLRHLADRMLEDEGVSRDGPADAGQAFFGQFIDHDLTLDATTELGKAAGDPRAVRNVRTPRLDLDCV